MRLRTGAAQHATRTSSAESEYACVKRTLENTSRQGFLHCTFVAPFGGLERRLSTAPFCVGIPREDAPPVVLDFATSLVAEGKVNVASRGGKPLPPDSLIGPDGALSGDPALLYGPLDREGPRSAVGPGAIRAFGEHKGSGLALLCELLGGSLTGNGATEPGRKFANGMFSLYVDPKQVDPSHVFDADMTRYLDWFRQARTLPGEAWASILAAARSVGVKRDVRSRSVRPRSSHSAF